MKRILEVKTRGVLSIVERLPSSRNGNPRYYLSIGGIHCRTAPDSDLAYGLTNDDGKHVVAFMRYYYGKPTLVDYMLDLAASTTDRHVALQP